MEYELVSVPDTVQYKWTTTKEDYVIVGVQASEEARIVLTETYWNIDNAYTVILGHLSNQHSVIRNGSDELIEETVDLLSPDEIRYFWISWQGQVKLFPVKLEGYIIFFDTIVDFKSPIKIFGNAFSKVLRLVLEGWSARTVSCDLMTLFMVKTFKLLDWLQTVTQLCGSCLRFQVSENTVTSNTSVYNSIVFYLKLYKKSKANRL